MERNLKITEDGSHTMYVKDLDEPYHSTHGAIQESMHVFIQQGLLTVNRPVIRILELGFGTGLNAVLTLAESLQHKLDIYYHTIEKYPLKEAEYKLLNFEEIIHDVPKRTLHKMHSSPWEEPVQITDHFILHKEGSDFRDMKVPPDINLVYFDAFSPDKQPELWSSEVIGVIGQALAPGAILVTYSSKGIVRRTLKSCGFDVLKVPGPPGKREMIRATKR